MSIVPIGTTLGRTSRIFAIESGVVSFTPPAAIGIGASVAGVVTIAGIRVGDVVLIQPPNTIEDDLVFQGAEVTGDDSLTIRLTNEGAAPVTGIARNWPFIWHDKTGAGGT